MPWAAVEAPAEDAWGKSEASAAPKVGGDSEEIANAAAAAVAAAAWSVRVARVIVAYVTATGTGACRRPEVQRQRAEMVAAEVVVDPTSAALGRDIHKGQGAEASRQPWQG